MRVDLRVFGVLVCGLMVAGLAARRADAANAYPVATDINQGAASFTNPWAGQFGAYTLNSSASLNGNAVLGITQNPTTMCCHGTSVVVAVSNGENGDNGSPDSLPNPTRPNTDPVNTTPANSVFNTIGNSSGKLEDGNVVRLSAWFRSDPANPITIEPQVAPVLKIEYWKQGLDGTGDTNATQIFPNFGDRVFDQDQQGYAIGISDPAAYVDINGDGTVAHDNDYPPKASTGNGRLFGISTGQWTLASVTHKVNVADWFGIGTAGYGAMDVTKIESIQGVVFVGEFSTTPITSSGTLLVDNMLIEVFKDAAAVTPLANPSPTLSEVTGLAGDFNNSHTVDAADYTVWRDNFGATEGNLLNGNGNNDTTINAGDYNLWKANFGDSSGAGAIASSAVPEPATLWLLALGLIGFAMRRSN